MRSALPAIVPSAEAHHAALDMIAGIGDRHLVGG